MTRKVGFLLLVIMTLLPLLPSRVEAFPGDKNDEKCEDLIQQALEALNAGQPVEEPDCINSPGMSAMEMRAAYARMQLYPTSTVHQVPIADEILHERRFRRLVGVVDIYDAPNGNVIRTLDQGYNFVTIAAVLDGWVQIGATEWVKSEVVEDADVSGFAGVEILEPLERPFAWVVS